MSLKSELTDLCDAAEKKVLDAEGLATDTRNRLLDAAQHLRSAVESTTDPTAGDAPVAPPAVETPVGPEAPVEAPASVEAPAAETPVESAPQEPIQEQPAQ